MCEDANDKDEETTTTKIIHCAKHGRGNAPPYVRCSSNLEFEMPQDDPSQIMNDIESSQQLLLDFQHKKKRTIRRRRSSLEVNQSLNLNLGLPLAIQRKLYILAKVGKILSYLFTFFESFFFQAWDKLPLKTRQRITMMAWKVYLPLHKFLLGKRTGIHADSSHEYHALTTIMYWSRFFPTTVSRIRFCLSQLSVWHPPEAYPPLVLSSCCDNKRQPTEEQGMDVNGGIQRRQTRRDTNDVHDCEEGEMDDYGQVLHIVKKTWGVYAQILEIRYDMRQYKKKLKKDDDNNDGDGDDDGDEGDIVTGYYIQQNPDKPSDKVLFWVYGGAFLGGDAKGNLELAEKMGHYSNNIDVFLPDYRLLPEYEFHHAIHDISLAYDYLINIRNVLPSNVTLLGISSGGGLVTVLLQNLAMSNSNNNSSDNKKNIYTDVEKANEKDTEKDDKGWKQNNMMPSGAVLIGPFVDYTEPVGSMKDYTAHDLIVTQAVLETGLPYLDAQGDHQKRTSISPAYQSFKGLPPLCVVVSEHEAVYDQTILMVNRARADGVTVMLGVWKYMCHVFPLLCAFLPESRQSVDFMCDWIKNH